MSTIGGLKKKAEKPLAEEEVFYKKLKVKLKKVGEEGRREFLKDYLDYLISTNKSIPPDFPSFVREIMGLDERRGFLHINIWHEKCDLMEFVKDRKYEYRIEPYG